VLATWYAPISLIFYRFCDIKDCDNSSCNYFFLIYLQSMDITKFIITCFTTYFPAFLGERLPFYYRPNQRPKSTKWMSIKCIFVIMYTVCAQSMVV
jgi:hypothetical protein